MMNTNRTKFQSLCFLAGALLFLSLITGCARNPVKGSQDFVMLSEDAEIAIGRTNHTKIIQQYGRYQDEALQSYVQQIGERLAAVSHRPKLEFHFTVLDSPIINAFALPGGYIYISRGLMAYLNSEAELAAVLGHEIGHVTARHGVRQQSAVQAAELGYTIGSILFPELRSRSSHETFNIFGGALLSGYGRDHELEADGLGAEYLARSDYEPQAMISVIKLLKNQELFSIEQAKKLGRKPQGYHGLFASHPDNDTRLQQVVASAKSYQSGKGLINRNAYLAKIDGLVFGDSEQQGIRSANNFYHGPMNFGLRFPKNWHIENGDARLLAIAPNGAAIIEMGASDINKIQSPEMFIRSRLKIQPQQGRILKSHGLRGYTGITKSKDHLVRVAVIYFNKQAFIFFSSAKENKRFNELDSEFLKTINSFHALSKQEQILAKPLKLRVSVVKRGDSYTSWAAQSRITNSPITQLRLLNDAYPNGKLEPGSLAKRVE